MSTTTETEIFRAGSDVVTTQRAVLSGTTYAVRQINSVRMETVPPNRRAALLLLGIGGVFLLSGVMLATDVSLFASSTLVALAIGAACIAAGVWLLKRAMATHYVLLSTSSGEVKSVYSTDEGLIQRYVAAISDAVVRQGQ